MRPSSTPLVAATLAAVARLAAAAALHEANGVLYGAWVDSAQGYSDTPVKYNTRLGLNASVFQLSQPMPVPKFNYTTGAGGTAPEYLVEQTATNAAVFLTVYPGPLANLIVDDYTALANQVLAYKTDFNRNVFVRWGPEMQGRWNVYGQQPAAFVAAWKDMYTTVKRIAPDTAIVWSPNLGNGYPFGQTADIQAVDLTLLDTNNNGVLDQGDDPYTPYFPGWEYIDWVGLSVYFKQSGVDQNVAQDAGFCRQVYTGVGNGAHGFNWYDMFCTHSDSMACMISESGASYHPNDQVGTATELQVQRAWWQDCITNPVLFQTFPRIKLHMHFEYEKFEASNTGGQDLRDFRLTNDTTLLENFKQDLAAVSSLYEWATYVPLPTSVQSNGPGITAPSTANQASATLVLQTVRNPMVTAPPTLFGQLAVSSAVRVWIEIGFWVFGSMALGTVVVLGTSL